MATEGPDTLNPSLMDTGHGQNVDDLSRSLQRFNWPDYLVFVLMLVSCIFIGIYFGYKDHQKHKNRKTARRDSEALDYLVGGRKMKIFPVAVSLVASWISGISLLGTSTEIYVYGTQYCYIVFAIVLMGFAMHYIFLPVFHDLQITSAYEYLQLRFDKRMRLIGSILFTMASILWLPIVVYVPALAFNQVSGVNIHVITPIVCLVCIFYTSVGGLKAVVWTDVIQTSIMVGAMIIVIIKGTLDVGGLGVVIERNSLGQRFDKPDFNLDPTERNTFWNLFIGGTFFWTSTNATNQNMIQRYLSLPSLKSARKALLLFLIGTTAVLSLCCYNGLLIYAMYHDCDPLSTGLAKAKDQLVPLLVMEVLAIYPGLAGLFVAGIFSAALSSLSTALNSLSAIVLEDFCKPFVKRPLSEIQVRYLMRVTVLIFGALAVVLVMVVEKMGAVLQLSMSLGPVTLGPLFGLFVMGMFFPRINGTYLQMRFDKRMRVFGSVLFMVACLLWMPVVIYVPALAFNQVTGINIHTVTPIVCLICIFYTSVGGMKAVVWTDVIQSAVTLGAILVVLIKGVIDIGGPSVVLERNLAGKRIEAPIYDPNPTLRHSVWTMWIGGSVWYTYGVSCSQDMIQRYLSLPTLDHARKALRGFIFGMILVIVLLSSIGMLIYATYHDCDPLTTNLAAAKDQLLPLFVMDIFQNYPGAAGVFVAGIFSAALSSLSSALNALAAITFEDFVKPYFEDKLTEKQIAITLRGSVLIFGIISVIFIYVVEHLGAVMQLTMTLSSTSGGPLFGLFVMGILMPWVNATGALYGGLAGFLSMCYLCFRSQASMATGQIIYSTKQMDVSGCLYQYSNVTKPDPTFDEMEKSIHHISYLYFTLFGTIVSCTVGSLVSLLSNHVDSEPIDPKLLAPFIRRFIEKHTKPQEKYPLNSPVQSENINMDIHQPE